MRKLKGAFINYFGEIVGVEKKIKQEAKIFKSFGVDTYILNLKKTEFEDYIYYINLLENSTKFNFINKHLIKLFRFKKIERLLPIDNYDFIILRYPLMDFSTVEFAKKYGYKIITEHHTKELDELRSYRKGKAKTYLKYILEKYFASKIFKYTKALVGVTEEIVDYEIDRLKFNGPIYIFPNGIKVEDVKFTQFLPFDHKHLSMIFVASHFVPWHGLDILLDVLSQYKGNISITLNIVGKVDKDLSLRAKYISDTKRKINIKLWGIKYGLDLDKIYKNVNLGISSLALFRKKMEEACALKAREYIARGLPFIYGYRDSDLTGDEEFALRVDPYSLSVKDIIEFVSKVSQIPNLSYKMREFAFKHLDWEVKIKNLYKFIEDIFKDET